MKKTLILLLLVSCSYCFGQKLDKLTVEKIMRDPKWMGISPSNISWSIDSKKVYFNWNPENADREALYGINPADPKPEKVGLDERKAMLPTAGPWNKAHTLKLYEKERRYLFAGCQNLEIGTADQHHRPGKQCCF